MDGIDKFVDVIGITNTPMALAALSLLVVGTILYANIKGRHRPDITKFGFGLAALFGVLAMAGFFLDSYSNEIFLAEGVIVDENNRPVEGALIDMGRSGRSASLPDGSYKIPIRRRESAANYALSVQKPGYEDANLSSIPGPYPAFQRVKLTSRTFTSENVVLRDDASFALYLGAPEVFLNFAIKNDTIFAQSVQSVILRLTSPQGVTHILYGNQVIENGTPPRQFAPIGIGPNQEHALQIGFFDAAVIQAATIAADQSGLLGPYGCNPSSSPEEAETLPQLEALFDRNFIWTQGRWRARLSLSTTRTTLTKAFEFDISDHDSRGLRSMREAYKFCAGLLYLNRYVSIGNMRSAIVTGIEQK